MSQAADISALLERLEAIADKLTPKDIYRGRYISTGSAALELDGLNPPDPKTMRRILRVELKVKCIKKGREIYWNRAQFLEQLEKSERYHKDSFMGRRRVKETPVQ